MPNSIASTATFFKLTNTFGISITSMPPPLLRILDIDLDKESISRINFLTTPKDFVMFSPVCGKDLGISGTIADFILAANNLSSITTLPFEAFAVSLAIVPAAFLIPFSIALVTTEVLISRPGFPV